MVHKSNWNFLAALELINLGQYLFVKTVVGCTCYMSHFKQYWNPKHLCFWVTKWTPLRVHHRTGMCEATPNVVHRCGLWVCKHTHLWRKKIPLLLSMLSLPVMNFEKVSSADASSDLMNFFKKSKHCLSAWLLGLQLMTRSTFLAVGVLKEKNSTMLGVLKGLLTSSSRKIGAQHWAMLQGRWMSFWCANSTSILFVVLFKTTTSTLSKSSLSSAVMWPQKDVSRKSVLIVSSPERQDARKALDRETGKYSAQGSLRLLATHFLVVMANGRNLVFVASRGRGKKLLPKGCDNVSSHSSDLFSLLLRGILQDW